MKVQVGTTLSNGRMIKLEVDEDDALDTFGDKWTTWSVAKSFKMLSTYADSLIVNYLKDSNEISPEQAKSRIAALQEIMRS